MIRRNARLIAWALLLMAGSMLPQAALAQTDQAVDLYGDERIHCAALRQDGKITEAHQCLQGLWSSHHAEMSAAGKVELLRQMAELYCVADSRGEAQACYEAILAIDPHWLPPDFDALPTSWRDPIMAAYRARGYMHRSPGLRNIAILDFEIADLAPDGVDLSALSRALPDYISSYLQESIDGAKFKDDARPLKVVGYRERSRLMDSIAASTGLDETVPLTADAVSSTDLVQAGRLQAVQGFLSGAIIREPSGKVNVAIRLLSVETGEISCPVTERGKAKDLFPKLQDALQDWLECAVEGAEFRRERGPGELGPMAEGVQALDHYHNALALLEAENFGEALVQARAALDLRPGNSEFVELIQVLQEQSEDVDLVQSIPLPAPELAPELAPGN